MSASTKKTNEWWRGSVLYQVYPRSFYSARGTDIGDLKGITQKLDHIASLGVSGVWLSPFFKSPMVDAGYDVSDYREIDPIFGSMEDFDEMLAEMHKRGLKLIIDLVLSHTSNKHPWFQESRKDRTNPKADWYVWANPKPDGSAPNNWLSVFGGPAWKYDAKRGQYYYHQFFREQPDLNLHNPEVQEELLAAAKFWLDKGVDGFRLDALNHGMHDQQLRDNPAHEGIDRSLYSRQTHPYYWQRHLYDKTQPEMLTFVKRLRKLTDQYQDRMIVAEIGDDNQVKTSVSYTNGPEMLHTAYSFALLGPDGYSPRKIRETLEEYMNEPGESWPTWAFSNHDVVRVASRWAVNGNADDAQKRMLLALLTSLRGTSFVYQGEELGLTEATVPFEKIKDPFGLNFWPEDIGRDGCRTPIPWVKGAKNSGFTAAAEPWLPIPAEHDAASVDVQEKDAGSHLHFARNFIHWRKNHPALATGNMTFIDMPHPLLAFRRHADAEDMLCVFNLGTTEVEGELPFAVEPVDGHGFNAQLDGQKIKLPAFGVFYGRKK